MAYIGNPPAPQNITSSEITDGTIVNVDIASDAAIAVSKIAGLGTAATTAATSYATAAQGTVAANALPKAGGTMSGDIDGNGNKVLFANMYAATSDLPNAGTYHGMFAHVHGTGKGYFAHAGNWVELANASDAAAGTVTSVTAGAGMTQSGTSTVNPTLNVIANNGIAAAANSIGLTGNALKLHNASTVSSLSVDFLEADVIVADHISANTIEANMLTVGQTGQSSNRMLLLEDCIKIFSGTTLRVHLGNLSNNAT